MQPPAVVVGERDCVRAAGAEGRAAVAAGIAEIGQGAGGAFGGERELEPAAVVASADAAGLEVPAVLGAAVVLAGRDRAGPVGAAGGEADPHLDRNVLGGQEVLHLRAHH